MSYRTRIRYGVTAFFLGVGMLHTADTVAALLGIPLELNEQTETPFIIAGTVALLGALAKDPGKILFGDRTGG